MKCLCLSRCKQNGRGAYYPYSTVIAGYFLNCVNSLQGIHIYHGGMSQLHPLGSRPICYANSQYDTTTLMQLFMVPVLCINSCVCIVLSLNQLPEFSNIVLWTLMVTTLLQSSELITYVHVHYTIGCPKVVRADHGTENAKLAYIQPFLRNTSINSSFRYGKSVSNQVGLV